MLPRTHLTLAAVSLLMVAIAGCSASADDVSTPQRSTNSGSGTPARPAETLSVNSDDTTPGIDSVPESEAFNVGSESPEINGPKCNILVPQAGSLIPVRVTHDDPTPLIREAIPNKTFLLVHAELYTDRGIGPHMLPPSTVIIRDTLFQEAQFNPEKARTSGKLDDAEGVTTVRLSCASSPTLANEAPDAVYYSKVEGELILERVTSQGVLRRFYR